MESFVTLKNNGIKRMDSKKYSDAIRDFTGVIDKLNPATNEEAVLKGVCLLNRSSCYLFQNKIEQAFADANSVIALYQSLRPEEQQKAMTPEQMKADPLTGVLSLAYIRRGEAFEAQLEFLEAFHEYAASSMLVPEGESQRSIRSLLSKLNVPEINQHDKELQPFAVLLLQFVNEASLAVALTNLIEYLSKQEAEQGPTPEILAKFDSAKCPNILYALIQLYIENEFIVVGSVTAIRMLAERGLRSVWNGFMIIREVMVHWHGSENICGESLKFLYLSPQDLYKYMIKQDFIKPVADSLRLKLTSDEIEKAFFLLYQISSSPSQIQYVVDSGVIDHILVHKSIGALMLMSKISIVNDIVIQTRSNGGLDWILKTVKDFSDQQELIIAAAIIISRMLILESDEMKPDKGEIEQMFDIFVPLVIKNSKDYEVVSSCFAAFALAASVAPQKITEHKLIRAASAILAIHMKNTTVAQNIVTFFYESAVNGLLEEVKETKPVIPTVMKALQEHPQYQPVVERAVVLAVLCDHQNKEKLFSAAREQFPNSTFLLKFAKQNEEKQ